jgi:hypothetical protein
MRGCAISEDLNIELSTWEYAYCSTDGCNAAPDAKTGTVAAVTFSLVVALVMM